LPQDLRQVEEPLRTVPDVWRGILGAKRDGAVRYALGTRQSARCSATPGRRLRGSQNGSSGARVEKHGDGHSEAGREPCEKTSRRTRPEPERARGAVGREVVYAVVHKVRRKGRVVGVNVRVVFGTEEQLCAALHCSSVSEHVNIAYVERYNATDRHLNSRKARKVYSFSKHPLFHEAATYFTQGIYNFCRHNRGLTIKTRRSAPSHSALSSWPKGGSRPRGSRSRTRLTRRTPAMASGITDHIWTVEEFVRYQACPPVTL